MKPLSEITNEELVDKLAAKFNLDLKWVKRTKERLKNDNDKTLRKKLERELS